MKPKFAATPLHIALLDQLFRTLSNQIADLNHFIESFPFLLNLSEFSKNSKFVLQIYAPSLASAKLLNKV